MLWHNALEEVLHQDLVNLVKSEKNKGMVEVRYLPLKVVITQN